mgnify:CR=1 FL=1
MMSFIISATALLPVARIARSAPPMPVAPPVPKPKVERSKMFYRLLQSLD